MPKSARRVTILFTIVVGSASVQLVVAAQDGPPKVTVTQREYDTRQLVTPPTLSAAALRGRTLWLQRCALCHDGVGAPTYETMGPWLDAEVVRSLGDSRVRERIAKGSPLMPGFQYTLASEQVDQILAFLDTVTPDQKPTANQLKKVPPP